MRKFFIALIAVFIALIYVVFINELGPWRPELIIIFLSIGMFIFSFKEFTMASLICAVIADIASTLPFGVVGGSILLTMVLLYNARQFLFVERYWIPVVVSSALGVLLFYIFGYGISEILFFFKFSNISIGHFMTRLIYVVVPSIIVSALVTVCAAPFLHKYFLERV